MRRARLPAIAAVVIALVLIAPSRRAGACTCPIRELAEQVQTASTVFVGTARSVTDTSVTFRAERVYKGDAPRTPIATGGADPTCAVPFAEGRRYVVFAGIRNGALATDLCSGTTDDLSLAERLSIPASPSPRAAPTTVIVVVTSRTIPIAAAAGLAALVGAASLSVFRLQRRPRPVA